jgi:hypothetical protein
MLDTKCINSLNFLPASPCRSTQLQNGCQETSSYGEVYAWHWGAVTPSLHLLHSASSLACSSLARHQLFSCLLPCGIKLMSSPFESDIGQHSWGSRMPSVVSSRTALATSMALWNLGGINLLLSVPFLRPGGSFCTSLWLKTQRMRKLGLGEHLLVYSNTDLAIVAFFPQLKRN